MGDRSYSVEAFSIDRRALTLSRVMLGLVLIYDNWTEWFRYSETLLSRHGVVPQATWHYHPMVWSLFRSLDAEWFALLLIWITLIASAFLVVGYRTRLSVVILWVAVLFFLFPKEMFSSDSDLICAKSA